MLPPTRWSSALNSRNVFTSDWLQAQDIVPAPSAHVSSHTGRRRQRTDTDEPEEMISELLDEEEAAVYQRLRVSNCPEVSSSCHSIESIPKQGKNGGSSEQQASQDYQTRAWNRSKDALD
jgi:hypothetical protein